MFEYLAALGYRGFEFFQFTQNVNELGRQPTHAEIRSYLDNAGLASFGTHTGGLGSSPARATRVQPDDGGLSAAGRPSWTSPQTLGHTMIGTAGDPTGRRPSRNPATTASGWTEMARRANVIGQILADNGAPVVLAHRAERLAVLQHAGASGASARTGSTGGPRTPTRSLVLFEPDILHSYSGRARFPDPVDG